MIRILFFGTPDFAARILERLLASAEVEVACVVTKPDKAAGRGQKIIASSVANTAQKNALSCIKPISLRKNTPQFISEVSTFGPFDLGIVVAYGQILPKEILELPKFGCVNIHASLLPRWRGAAPINRAIMAGDKESGICLMKMDEGLDTGAVFAHSRVPIGSEMTAGELHDQLAQCGADLVVESIKEVYEGRLVAHPQPIEGVTYAEKISPDEALIDWSKTAEEIARRVNGLSPFPGAFTSVSGQRLKLFRCRAISSNTGAKPGTITTSSGELCRVACLTGEVAILEVQLEGKKRLPIAEFLRGSPLLQPGTILGM